MNENFNRAYGKPYTPYTPVVGDHVAAYRRVKTTGPNTVIGPVVKVVDDACHIRCNEDYPDMYAEFILPIRDWKFVLLFTEENQ